MEVNYTSSRGDVNFKGDNHFLNARSPSTSNNIYCSSSKIYLDMIGMNSTKFAYYGGPLYRNFNIVRLGISDRFQRIIFIHILFSYATSIRHLKVSLTGLCRYDNNKSGRISFVSVS